MKTRAFNKDGPQVSEVGLGCWQIGGDQWGEVSQDDALATIKAAVDAGTTFLDTADIYGSGRSEEFVGAFRKTTKTPLFIATKLGKNPRPGGPANCTTAVMEKHAENSLKRLGVECIDLLQLHCVPLEELQRGEVFEALRGLHQQGKIARFGASVESIEEAKVCLQQEGLASLQIIFNIYRQTAITELFDEAATKGVSIIVRLPLASGLLAGGYSYSTKFAPTDHRSYNRNGEKFHAGETFAGLGFDNGIELTTKLKALLPPGVVLPVAALRWCLDFPAVTVIIPGARNPKQAQANASASDAAPLSPQLHERLRRFFQDDVKPHIKGKD
jgi:aryl-alcohol dehydrogenase-like predicted oxidoreductase